jgi:hypothetical protein
MQPSTPSGGLFGPDFGVGPWDFPGYRTPGGEGIFLPVARRSGPSIPHAIDTSGLPSGRPSLNWPTGGITVMSGSISSHVQSKIDLIISSHFQKYGMSPITWLNIHRPKPASEPPPEDDDELDPGVLCVGNDDGTSSYYPLAGTGGYESTDDGGVVPVNRPKKPPKSTLEKVIDVAFLIMDVVDVILTIVDIAAAIPTEGASLADLALRKAGIRSLKRTARNWLGRKIRREAGEAITEGVARRGLRDLAASAARKFVRNEAGHIANDLLLGGVKLAQGIAKLTKREFRNNLIKQIGRKLGLYEAHHIFPVEFAGRIWDLWKINVHDPRFGAWVGKRYHRRISRSWNAEWRLFIHRKPTSTDEEAMKFAVDLARKYHIDWP